MNFSFSGFERDEDLYFPPSQSEDVVVYGGREGFGQGWELRTGRIM